MCGRYSLTTPVEAMARVFGFPGPWPNLPPRYNIAPTQTVPVLRAAAGGGVELAQVRWGLVPSWAKDPSAGARMINARAETVAGKPAFRAAFRRRRCLVPADGFYEWRKTPDGRRQPWRIARPDGAPFAFAGLWERWEKAADGTPLETCTIVTTAANDVLRPIHPRMPVILDPADFAAWLDPATPPGAAAALLRPAPNAWLVAVPVSTRVNDVRHDDPGCIEPLAGPVDAPPPRLL